MTSALCALRHVDNHGAAAHLQKSPLFVRSCLQGVHWGRGGAIRWYEKNTNYALED